MKLNLHWQNTTNWMRRVPFSSPYVKIMNPPEDNIFPDKRTIGRVYMDDGEEGRYYSRGSQGGIDYFHRCLSHYLKAKYIYAWESWNEPAMIKTPEERKMFDEATVSWLDMMHSHGLLGVAGNFSVRTPEDIQDFPGLLEQTDFLGVHLYGPGHELRDFEVEVPILIGECGIDLGVIGKEGGWKKYMSFEEYKEYLLWYSQELDKDDKIEGAFIFTAGASSKWMTFNINEKQARELSWWLG